MGVGFSGWVQLQSREGCRSCEERRNVGTADQDDELEGETCKRSLDKREQTMYGMSSSQMDAHLEPIESTRSNTTVTTRIRREEDEGFDKESNRTAGIG